MGGFAQNLIEGFAGAAGDQNTVNRIEKDKANKTALSHAELQTQTQSILDDVGGLQKRRAALDPKSPTYAQDIGDIDANLHKARQTLTDLYHPANNPGALQHLGGFIKAHIGRQGQPANAGQAKQRIKQHAPLSGDFGATGSWSDPRRGGIGRTIAELDAAAATPGQTADNPYADQIRNLEAVGISHEDAVRSVREKAGLEAKETPTKFQPQLTTTTDANGTQHYWRVPLESGAPPEEVGFQGEKVQPKASGAGPIRAWKRKNGKVVSVLLDRATNKEIPGSENPDIAPPAAQAGRISTGFYHWVDDNNQVHSTPETRTSMPAGSAGAGIPRTAGEAKDRILGTKISAPVNKAQSDFQEATKLASVADQVAKHPNDAVNQKRLAVALERASAGRFTTQALDYILKAGWGNTIEQWANNPSTGALPADIMRQLVDGAHENLRGAKDALAAAHSTSGGAPTTAQPSGKAVSLAKAKQLPAMKGKTDDQIRQAIEQSGHQVIP